MYYEKIYNLFNIFFLIKKKKKEESSISTFYYFRSKSWHINSSIRLS